MDEIDITLKIVTVSSTVALFMYGLFQGYDDLELFIYNIYFVALILYLIKTNLIKD